MEPAEGFEPPNIQITKLTFCQLNYAGMGKYFFSTVHIYPVYGILLPLHLHWHRVLERCQLHRIGGNAGIRTLTPETGYYLFSRQGPCAFRLTFPLKLPAFCSVVRLYQRRGRSLRTGIAVHSFHYRRVCSRNSNLVTILGIEPRVSTLRELCVYQFHYMVKVWWCCCILAAAPKNIGWESNPHTPSSINMTTGFEPVVVSMAQEPVVRRFTTENNNRPTGCLLAWTVAKKEKVI